MLTTEKEIKLELAKVAISADSSIETAKRFYDWIIDEKKDTKPYEDIPISDLESVLDRYAVMFRNRCKENDIKTVGDILSMGRGSFRALHLVGDKLTRHVSEALADKYGITAW